MTSRERVIKTIEHRQPDRVPVDMGGSIMSGIAASTLSALRKHLGLEERPIKVYELFQMLGEVELDVVEELGIDILPVEPESIFFNIPRIDYKPWKLFDGTEVLVPGQFQVDIDTDGSWLLHDAGNPSNPVVARMPKGGFYFDTLPGPDMIEPPPLSDMEKAYRQPIPQERLDFLAQQASTLRKTGKALFFGDWLLFGPPMIGNLTDWLCLLVTEPDYMDRLFQIRTETELQKLDQLYRAIGDTVDILGIDGIDYGTQRSEMFNPELFERYFLPYYTAVNSWIHEHTSWKTWKHSCGSIANIIGYLVDSGLDCINPVQTTAEGMDASWLKREFGDKVTFWGGGVDTQHTLPFGTPDEVYKEVKERIRIFAPGGGFIFNAVHNIQANTPPENLAAMFQAVKDYGAYPISF